MMKSTAKILDTVQRGTPMYAKGALTLSTKRQCLGMGRSNKLSPCFFKDNLTGKRYVQLIQEYPYHGYLIFECKQWEPV